MLSSRAMVTIGMNYSVLAGKEDVFEGACRKVLDIMSKADGHQDSQIFRRVDVPESSEYLIVSRWATRTRSIASSPRIHSRR